SSVRQLAVTVDGTLARGVTAKDLALTVVARLGFGGASGHVLEFRGSCIEQLSIEGRLTLCNMSAETGARTSIIAPDEITFEYVRGKKLAPQGLEWEQAVGYWRSLRSD